MSSKAFPVLKLPSVRQTYMTQVAPLSSELEKLLSGHARGGNQFRVSDSGSIESTLVVGSLKIPLVFVGEPTEEKAKREVLVHSPGLPGAFPVQLDTLRSVRGFLTPGIPTANVTISSLCVAAALQPAYDSRLIMDRLYRVARRRHFSLAGTESLLRVGSSLNVDGLELTFPYHCGSEHSIKEYLDISPEVCALFDENETGTSLHGCKVLTRYGVSTSVGVVKKEGVLGVPALLWHPSGAACARLAPLLHACRRIKVGDVKLVYNGPSSSCDVLRPESPRLYMKDDAIDDTVWITQGLFNGVPGQAWDDKWDVIGVAFNDAYGEMDLIGRHRETKEEMPLDDLRHPTAE